MPRVKDNQIQKQTLRFQFFMAAVNSTVIPAHDGCQMTAQSPITTSQGIWQKRYLSALQRKDPFVLLLLSQRQVFVSYFHMVQVPKLFHARMVTTHYKDAQVSPQNMSGSLVRSPG